MAALVRWKLRAWRWFRQSSLDYTYSHRLYQPTGYFIVIRMSRRILLSCGRAVGSLLPCGRAVGSLLPCGRDVGSLLSCGRAVGIWVTSIMCRVTGGNTRCKVFFKVRISKPYITPEGGVVIRRVTVHFLRSMMLSDSANMYGRMNSFF